MRLRALRSFLLPILFAIAVALALPPLANRPAMPRLTPSTSAQASFLRPAATPRRWVWQRSGLRLLRRPA